MGKNLKGKECGKGICQRKDSLYYARFVDKAGKRQVKCFSSQLHAGMHGSAHGRNREPVYA